MLCSGAYGRSNISTLFRMHRSISSDHLIVILQRSIHGEWAYYWDKVQGLTNQFQWSKFIRERYHTDPVRNCDIAKWINHTHPAYFFAYKSAIRRCYTAGCIDGLLQIQFSNNGTLERGTLYVIVDILSQWWTESLFGLIYFVCIRWSWVTDMYCELKRINDMQICISTYIIIYRCNKIWVIVLCSKTNWNLW